MFNRSERKRNVRYTRFVADGDSKNWKTIADNNPYGPEVRIEKYECIGHVGKRMGARLRKLRKEKNLGGKGGVSDALIKKIQSYYSNAIRKHSTVNEMQTAIWAIYFHYLSSDDDPQHHNCPTESGTWCAYWQAANNDELDDFTHTVKVQPEKWGQTKPVFEDLTNRALLERCSNGYRQNVNESFNSLIWIRIPKTIYRSIDSVRLGLFDAVICSNEGYSGRLKVLEMLGIEISHKTSKGCEKLDAIQEAHSQQSGRGRSKNSDVLDEENPNNDVFDEEDVNDDAYLYEAGMHD